MRFQVAGMPRYGPKLDYGGGLEYHSTLLGIWHRLSFIVMETINNVV
jgi:hypothetical protein